MLDKLLSRVPTERRARLEQVRHDAWVRRTEGRVALWSLQTRGLERAHALLEDVPVPVRPLLTLVEHRLDAATSVPISDYDALNARNAATAVKDLDLLALQRVARYEKAHKDRKTVHAAVERQRQRLLAMPELAA